MIINLQWINVVWILKEHNKIILFIEKRFLLCSINFLRDFCKMDETTILVQDVFPTFFWLYDGDCMLNKTKLNDIKLSFFFTQRKIYSTKGLWLYLIRFYWSKIVTYYVTQIIRFNHFLRNVIFSFTTIPKVVYPWLNLWCI